MGLTIPVASTGPILLKDSRRLPGINLLWDRPGAIIDAAFADDHAERAIALWEAAARTMLDAVGWKEEGTRVRRFPGGANLALSAPLDSLYTATEVNVGEHGDTGFAEKALAQRLRVGTAGDAACFRYVRQCIKRAAGRFAASSPCHAS